MSSDLVKKDLQTLDFYLKSISLFLRGSYGMEDRVKMYFDILQNVIDVGDTILLKKLDIWRCDEYGNPNYFDDCQWDSTEDYWLDLVGSIFGLRRKVWMSDDEQNRAQYTLTNYEFLLYIQAFAAKNRFDGSTQSLRKVYTGSTVFNYKGYTGGQVIDPKLIDSNYKDSYLAGLGIIYCNGENSLEAKIILNNKRGGSIPYGLVEGTDVVTMFMNHMLSIESLGITYTPLLSDNFEVAQFQPAIDPEPEETEIGMAIFFGNSDYPMQEGTYRYYTFGSEIDEASLENQEEVAEE